jgi:hypothetical protein
MRWAFLSLLLLHLREDGIVWHVKRSYTGTVKNWAAWPGSFLCIYTYPRRYGDGYYEALPQVQAADP